MRLKGNLIVWLLVGFLIIALGNKFIRGDGTKNTVPADTAPVTEEVSKLGESQLGKVLTTGEWSHTLPGKFIDDLLGAGWSNWVLWFMVVIFAYAIITRFVAKPKGSSSSLADGVLWIIGIIGFVAIVVSAVSDPMASTVGSASYPQRLSLPDGRIIPVDLRKMASREEKLVTMNITDTARIQGKMVESSPGRLIGDGVTVYGFCARVVQPDWVLTHPKTPKEHFMFPNKEQEGLFHDMKFTDDMMKFLVLNRVTSVTVSFYLVLTKRGMTPKC